MDICIYSSKFLFRESKGDHLPNSSGPLRLGDPGLACTNSDDTRIQILTVKMPNDLFDQYFAWIVGLGRILRQLLKSSSINEISPLMLVP